MIVSNAQKGLEFERIAKKYFEEKHKVKFKKTKIKIGFNGGKLREVDLVNEELKIIIECKNFRYTSGNNVPSAKISDFIKEVYKLYIAPEEYKKIICISKSYNKKGISLKNYILDKYYDFIPETIEVIEI